MQRLHLGLVVSCITAISAIGACGDDGDDGPDMETNESVGPTTGTPTDPNANGVNGTGNQFATGTDAGDPLGQLVNDTLGFVADGGLDPWVNQINNFVNDGGLQGVLGQFAADGGFGGALGNPCLLNPTLPQCGAVGDAGVGAEEDAGADDAGLGTQQAIAP